MTKKGEWVVGGNIVPNQHTLYNEALAGLLALTNPIFYLGLVHVASNLLPKFGYSLDIRLSLSSSGFNQLFVARKPQTVVVHFRVHKMNLSCVD